MPRPKRNRKMNNPPMMLGFRPFGIPRHGKDSLKLLFDEYEAIKLCDYNLLTQVQAAQLMNVSRPTFTRIYEKARQTIAKALVEGRAVSIEGGNVTFEHDWYKCEDCHKLHKVPKNQEFSICCNCQSKRLTFINESLEPGTDMGSKATESEQHLGSGGRCICLHCGHAQSHFSGVPCMETRCEKCGHTMLREGSHHHKEYLKKQANKLNGKS